MRPVAFSLSYRLQDGGAIALSRPFGSCEAEGLSVCCTCDERGFSVSVTPRDPVTVESCSIALEHGFAADEQVLLNGYQSWTDTAEEPALAVERGLVGAPRLTVSTFALDALGDYRFFDYRISPGVRHGWTYATFERDGKFTLLGSLDETRGFTLIRTDARSSRIHVEPEVPLHRLSAGQPVTLASMAVERGSQREVYDHWLARAGIKARTQTPLCGYSSWYRHYASIDAKKLASDLEGARTAFSHLDASGFAKVFQIDDGWCAIGDWASPHPEAFPDGMAALASRIADAGFVPGLWMAPLVAERLSHTYCLNPGWILHDEAGNEVVSGSHWSGHAPLDTLNPSVRDAIRTWVGTAVCEWGFKLLKLDFLYAACLVPHGGMNRGELMADAVALVREAAGDDCIIIGCGVPLASAFGTFDYCRIGCDVGLDWNDKPHMRLLHRERVSTKNSLLNTIGRSPLDGRAFGNDPDVVFLRDDTKLSAERRELLLYANSSLASALLTSDDMGAWSADTLEAYQTALDRMRERKGL